MLLLLLTANLIDMTAAEVDHSCYRSYWKCEHRNANRMMCYEQCGQHGQGWGSCQLIREGCWSCRCYEHIPRQHYSEKAADMTSDAEQ